MSINILLKFLNYYSKEIIYHFFATKSIILYDFINLTQVHNFTHQPFEVKKRAKIRNRYNQGPHLTQDTNGKVTTSQLDIAKESEEVSPFPAGDHKAKKLNGPNVITQRRRYIYIINELKRIK